MLSDEHRERWAAATYWVRGCELALKEAVDPRPDSWLAHADRLYRWEKVSAWSRSYLTAAIDHLLLWADLVAPYKFAEDHINHVRFRPYVMLGRAGLESSAHGVWLLADVDDPRDCVRRHLRLMHRDFEYQRKAQEAGGYGTNAVLARMEVTVERAERLGVGVSPKDKPPGYANLVRAAATTVGGDAQRWAFLWNAASGAAHGQNWFGMVGYDTEIGEEYEPGHYRSIQTPDPVFITEIVEAAVTVLGWGVIRWLLLAGFDGNSLVTDAMTEVHRHMPKKE